MKNENYNENINCKIMQNAALSELLTELKNLKTFSNACDILPIFNSIDNVLECYECISCTCLKYRAEHIIEELDFSDINKFDIKAFIAELETFLNSETKKGQEILL